MNTFADEGASGWPTRIRLRRHDVGRLFGTTDGGIFARYLDERATVGDALTFAKQQYVGNLAVISPYDMKAEIGVHPVRAADVPPARAARAAAPPARPA